MNNGPQSSQRRSHGLGSAGAYDGADGASGKIAARVRAEILGVVYCVLDQAGDRAMIAWSGNDDSVCGAQCFDQRRRTLRTFNGVVVREIQRLPGEYLRFRTEPRGFRQSQAERPLRG